VTPSDLIVAVDESKVTPGLLGFVVVALLGVATYLLIRSMNRQIHRIDLPDDPADGEQREGAGDDVGTDDEAGGR
jgi:hypothetical protein